MRARPRLFAGRHFPTEIGPVQAVGGGAGRVGGAQAFGAGLRQQVTVVGQNLCRARQHHGRAANHGPLRRQRPVRVRRQQPDHLPALALYLPLPFTLGTYPLTAGTGGAASGQAEATYWVTSAAPYNAASGSVTLTALDKTSGTGTFAFTARCAGALCPGGSTRTVANGVFRVRR